MGYNELTVKYGIELSGDGETHRELRETVERLGGEIVAEEDVGAYFEVDDE